MNMQTIGFILGGLLVSLVVGSFILPTELNIERAVLVNAQPEDLYDDISDLSKWNDWEPFGTGTTSEQTTGVGATRGWPGGQLVLSELKEDEVHYQVHDLPMPTTGFLALQEVDEGTAVVWVHQSQTGYGPIARISGWAARGKLAVKLDEGLNTLKANAERGAAPAPTAPPK